MNPTQLPPDAEPLEQSGFFAWADDWRAPTFGRAGINFFLYRQREDGAPVSQLHIATVNAPEEYPSAWGTPERWRHKISLVPARGEVSAATIRAISEVLDLSAGFADAMNESLQPEIDRAMEKSAARRAEEEKRRAEREEENRKWREKHAEMQRQRDEERRAREAMREARAAWLHERLRWMIGDQIRLTRDGKRSTVFGTIDVVADPWTRTRMNEAGEREEYTTYSHVKMFITTERGKHMDIVLADINKLDLKPDGERRFNEFYTAGMESATTT